MKRSQRWLLLFLAVMIALGAAWQFVPLADAQARLTALPAKGIGYESIDAPLSDSERVIFGDASVLKRAYRVGSDRFSVIVIDGTRNRHAVHDPMLCARGGGWSIAARAPFALPGGAGELVTITKGDQTSEVLYWFSDGVDRHASPTSYWLQSTLRRLTFGASGEEAVLVLLQAEPGRAIDWRRLLSDRFMAATAF
ncbi:MAG TPA: exosortase-associated EpsI family protein [Planctomycetota bacterium]|nr:exosortase-associated EpsI family protein [Planctomycetota bacterium]